MPCDSSYSAVVDQRAAWQDDDIDVKPASHGMCLDVLVDSVPAQLENDETFILPSAVMFQFCFPFFFAH